MHILVGISDKQGISLKRFNFRYIQKYPHCRGLKAYFYTKSWAIQKKFEIAMNKMS